MKHIIICFATLMMVAHVEAKVIDGIDFDKPGTLEWLSQLSRQEVDTLSPDVRREYFRRTSELHSGGIVEKPGAGGGTFLIVDSTGRLNDGMFSRDFGMLDRTLKVSPKIVAGRAVTAETATQVRIDMKANAAVFVVTNSALPRLITSSEDGWAIVNMSKLDVNNPAKEVLDKRITVEVIRGLGQIFGSGNNGLSMNAITSLEDIDGLQHTGFPASALKICQTQMRKLGFEPKVTASYRVACQQGWAPEPKTEAQRIIWNQYHTIPANPMKIEFDPAKGR